MLGCNMTLNSASSWQPTSLCAGQQPIQSSLPRGSPPMPPRLSNLAFRVVARITLPLTARSKRRSQRLASAVPFAIMSVTPPVTALCFHGRTFQTLLASPLLVSPPMMTTSVACTTNEPFVFEVQNAHTCTFAQPVGEATRDVPAPGRHNDINSQTTCTPLRPQVFARFLASHPNEAFVSRLIHSLTNGFDIGYVGPHTQLTAPNLPSAYQYPSVVDEALQKEIAEHRLAGPYSAPPFNNLHCSGIGVVPKKDGGWRLIYHLSAPSGHSINDFINKDEFSLQYKTVDDAIRMCQTLGPGALMAKVDLKNAFRLCPVRREDWHLLGIHWRHQYYIDKCLPFGLRSAPYLFNMVADAIEWILMHYFGVEHCFHYLDDFFLAGPPMSTSCARSLQDMLLLCEAVQAPVKPEKVLGPSTTLPFLGILLDSEKGEARLPEDKLAALKQELDEFHSLAITHKQCSKRQLLSLIGKLAFACKVIPAGRIFLRRLLDTAHSVDDLDVPFPIDNEAVHDIDWWLKFSADWNGKAFFLEPTWTPAHNWHLYTDASSTRGFGAYWNGAWFSHPWPHSLADCSIEWKELYAIVMACEVWGKQWSGKRLLFHCDNRAVVDVWESGLSRSSSLMCLVRALFFVAARCNFHVLIAHIPGIENSIADSLSRLQLQRFRSLAPMADPLPTPTPARLTLS